MGEPQKYGYSLIIWIDSPNDEEALKKVEGVNQLLKEHEVVPLCVEQGDRCVKDW